MAINGSLFQPLPTGGFGIGRTQVMNKARNLYKIPVYRPTPTDPKRTYEIWATKEAIKKHFTGVETPTPYHFREFARTLYQKTLENPEHVNKRGTFISATQQVHGNPKLFPSMVNDPEVEWV